MAVKSYHLQKLEELGVLYQNRSTGTWHTCWDESEDLTEALFESGMFEH